MCSQMRLTNYDHNCLFDYYLLSLVFFWFIIYSPSVQLDGKTSLKAWRNWPALFAQHQYLELGNFCLPVSPVAKSSWRHWQVSKHRTSNICLPTCKMCLPNMKCLKNLVVAKRACKDMLLKLSHVRQAVLVSFARPLQLRTKGCIHHTSHHP